MVITGTAIYAYYKRSRNTTEMIQNPETLLTPLIIEQSHPKDEEQPSRHTSYWMDNEQVGFYVTDK
jgi:hypothetical protein